MLAVVLAGSFVALSPWPAEARTYRTVASLGGPTKADRIVISRVGIDLPVRQGSVDGPILEHVAYRMPGTSWPGGGSNTYIYGHARTGTFLKLWKVRKGDVVAVRLGKAGWVRYRVITVRRVKWNDRRWLAATSSERLTLQTCTSYAPTADRFVVVAVPFESATA